MKRDVLTYLFLLCFPMATLAQGTYIKPPFDGQEAWLREVALEEMALDPLVINQDWMKRDSLTYLRFKDHSTILLYGTDAIPQWVTNFKQLKSLSSMPSALVKSIPENIGELTQLEDFVLLDSRISYIPQSFNNLTNLKHLNLVGDGKSEFPKDIKKLTQLESIFLADFGSIPNEIFELPNLKRLILYRCNIKVIPRSIKNLVHLEELNLQENPIKQVPEEIFELPSLINFKVDNGNLKTDIISRIDRQLSGNKGLHRERLRHLQDIERKKLFDKMREQQILLKRPDTKVKSYDL